MPQHEGGDASHVLGRDRGPSGEDRERLAAEHEVLARAGARPPLDEALRVLADLGIAGTRRPGERDGVAHDVPGDGNAPGQVLEGRDLLLAEDLNVGLPQSIWNGRSDSLLHQFIEKSDENGVIFADPTHLYTVVNEEIERYGGATLLTNTNPIPTRSVFKQFDVFIRRLPVMAYT